jgi:NADH:ubiquinone oxidoreductase subunit 5 (subunit L)/multisubunit Na+/H+ antiporter MnhA subunit
MDRVEAAMHVIGLGWFHKAMRNRFYFDQIYDRVFVRTSIWLADVFDAFDYGQPVQKEVDGQVVVVRKHGFVDGLVNGAGWIGRNLSELAGKFDSYVVDGLVNLVGRVGAFSSKSLDVFDLKIVDGTVNGVGAAIRFVGGWIRPIQTGKVQNYLLLAVLMVVALVAAFFLILFLAI